MRDVTRVLMIARARLARDGWVQNQAQQGTALCSGEAIGKASYDVPLRVAAQAEALQVLARTIGPRNRVRLPVMAIIGWNDEPGRTLEEVLSAFDKAIKASEEEGA